MMAEMGAFVAGSIVGKLLLDKTGWNSSVREVEKDERTLGGVASSIGKSFDVAGRKLTIVGGAIVGAFGAILKSTADAGDEIAKLSQKTGISTEILSGYKLSAELAGSSVGGLARGLKTLAGNMLDTSMGTGEAKIAFDALGISVADSEGKLRPLDNVLLDVADKFSRMEDGVLKTALAGKLFGERLGTELIPFLNQSSTELQKQYKEAERLGQVFSKEAAEGCEDFNDRLKELQAGLSGVARELAMQLMPMAMEFIIKAKAVVINVREWVAEHPALVKWLTESGLKLGLLLTGLGLFLTMLPRLILGIKSLTTSFGGLGAAIMIAYGAYKLLEEIRPGERISEELAVYGKLTKAIGYWSDFEDAAVRASVARVDDLRAIWDKYGQNTLETYKAIAEGKEGEALKKFLEELTSGHSKALIAAKDQKEELEKLNSFIPTLTETIKTELAETGVALGTNYGKIDALVVALWKSYVINFLPISETMIPQFIDRSRLMERTWTLVKGGIVDANSLIQGSFATLAKDIWKTKEDVIIFANEILRAMLGLRGIHVPFLESLAADAKTTTEKTSGYFDGLYNDIARGFGDFVSGIKLGNEGLELDFKALFGTIKDAFFTMIGEMVAGEVLKKFKSWFLDIGKAAVDTMSGAAQNATKAVTSITQSASGVVSGLWTGLGAAVGAFLAGIITGGGGLGKTEGNWIHEIRDRAFDIMHSLDWVLANVDEIKKSTWAHTGVFHSMNDHLKKIADYTAGLKDIQFGQHGINTVVNRPTLFMAGERGTERVQVSPGGKQSTEGMIEFHLELNNYIGDEKIETKIIKTVNRAIGLKRIKAYAI